jgi:transposase InsO family protein
MTRCAILAVVRMTNSLWMNFAWPTLKEDFTEFVKYCDECQRFKKARKHYGHLTRADSHTLVPWDQVAVDLIGPWTIATKNKTVKLTCLTTIDLATRWIEIQRVHVKTAENVALLFDRAWLPRYPRPTTVIHDAGTEFGQEFSDLLSSYGIHEVTTTVKNPRANAILERVHGVIGDMLRTYDFEHQKLDSWAKERQDPFDGFLAAVSFAIRATYQTSIGTSPAAMVFQRDMFFPTKFVATWQTQAQNRQIQLQRGVTRENAKRLPHRYHVGDRVLIRHDMDGQPRAKMKRLTSGPYKVTTTVRGSTIEIDRGKYLEKVNVRRLQPYFARP